jgi:DNA-binding IclR family transcriptional regulator
MPNSGTQTVERAIRLLKIFDDEQPEWSLADLVRAIEVNKTTVFRLLNTLENEGLVKRTAAGNYHLGSEMIALGGRAMRANELRTISHNYLRQLTRQSNETSTLEVLQQDRHGIWTMLVIDEVLGPHLVGVAQYIGGRLPIHTTSTGKVTLAYCPPDDRDDILCQISADKSDHSPIDLDEFRRELRQVREQGFALALGELEAGLMAAGAPVFDVNGEVQAAVSLVGPSTRVNRGKLLKLMEELKETARQISYQVGFRENDR